MPQQRALVEELSAKYVKMIASLHGNIDYIFRIYPYAIASAVCWGFYYLFPGSRHLYSTEFKNEIYLFVCQLLLGLKLCPVSVQSMRRQYFPDEVLDDVSSKSKALKPPMSAPSASVTSALAADAAFLPRIQSAAAAFGIESSTSDAIKIKKSASESYLGKQALNDNTIERILEVPATVSDDSGTSNVRSCRVVLALEKTRTRATDSLCLCLPLDCAADGGAATHAPAPLDVQRGAAQSAHERVLWLADQESQEAVLLAPHDAARRVSRRRRRHVPQVVRRRVL